MIDKQTAIKNGITIIESAEGKNALYECLKANFPQTIKENQVDLNAIATLLGLNANLANKQHYELIFTGKALANALYDSPCEKALTLQEIFDPNASATPSLRGVENAEAIQNTLANGANQKSPSPAEGDLGGGYENPTNTENPKISVNSLSNSQKNSQNSAIPLNLNTNSKENPQNSIIIGDNLDALKILKSAYTAQIKMIYIDPPYNTQSENFIYPDNFRSDYKDILREVGLLEVSEDGTEIESQTLKYFKNIQSTRTHSGWLAFMLPRLKLARDLLREDGVIFISIDDNEQANLRLLCDEIFGEDCFVNSIFVLDNLKGKSNDNFISNVGHKIIVYAKNAEFLNEKCGFSKVENIFGETMDKKYKNEDDLGLYTLNSFCKTGQGRYREDRPTMYYPILYKNGCFTMIDEKEFIEIYKDKFFNDNFVSTLKNKYENLGFKFILPINQNGEKLRWTSSYNGAKILIEKGDLILNSNSIMQKKRPDAQEMFQYYASGIPKNLMYKPQYANGTDDLTSIFNGKEVFSYPKPISLLKDLLKLITTPNSNDLILDFFAGSGTTAHAVMDLNAQDNGNRCFILVQLDEKIDENKQKTAFDFCKNELKSETPLISDITAERLRRVATKLANTNGANQKSPSPAVLGAGYKNAENPQNLSFNIYKLAPKPKLISEDLNSLFLTANEDLSGFDKALNLALQSGKRLDEPLEIIIENKLYKCKDSYFCVEFSDKVLEFLSKTKDEYIIIDGFSNIDLQSFLNANVRFNDRLRVVY